ncbi:ribonuclease H-like domain-containing protein [Tanacetum coccineum]
MKARGTLLMTLPNKDQLKFHLYKDAKLLMEAIEKSTNSYSNNNTNEADNTTYGVSAAHTQSNPTSGDNLVMHGICAFLTTRRIIKRADMKLDVNGQRVGFDRSKVECYNCHKYGHFAREYGIGGYDWSYQAEEEHLTNFALMVHTSSGSSFSLDCESQFNLVSYKAGLELVEARLAHYKKNEAVFEESINVLKLEVRLRDNALVKNKRKLEKAEKERNELKLTLEKFQNSSKSLNNLLESQVSDKFKTGLGYNACTAASPVVESFMNSSEMLENQEYNRSKGYHAVPPPYTRNFIPRKPDLTFIDEIVKSENMDITIVITPSNDKTVDKECVQHKDDLEDPSKQGRKITEIDQDPGISLVQHDAEIQGRHKHEPEFDFDDANIPVSTAGAEISTANPEVKTIGDSIKDIATETLVYIIRSVAKAKDKGKAKMEESESAMTKTKRQQEQERLGFEVVVRLQVELDKEER